MKRDDLLPFCRYYKDGEENPYEGKDQNKAMLWFYERAWIHDTLAIVEKGEAGAAEDDGRVLDEYLAVGLSEFENMDDTPITLKALLFNRYSKGNMSSMSDCVEPFKEFYKRYYN